MSKLNEAFAKLDKAVDEANASFAKLKFADNAKPNGDSSALKEVIKQVNSQSTEEILSQFLESDEGTDLS